MWDNSAFGVRSANTRPLDTWVNATLFNTCLGCLTIRIDFAFWLDNRFDDSRSGLATDKWITRVTVRTRTDRIVSDDLTLSINSASSRTRVFTFLSNAGHTV